MLSGPCLKLPSWPTTSSLGTVSRCTSTFLLAHSCLREKSGLVGWTSGAITKIQTIVSQIKTHNLPFQTNNKQKTPSKASNKTSMFTLFTLFSPELQMQQFVLSNFLFSSHRFSFCSDYFWESSTICYSWRLLQCSQMSTGIYDFLPRQNVYIRGEKNMCDLFRSVRF